MHQNLEESLEENLGVVMGVVGRNNWLAIVSHRFQLSRTATLSRIINRIRNICILEEVTSSACFSNVHTMLLVAPPWEARLLLLLFNVPLGVDLLTWTGLRLLLLLFLELDHAARLLLLLLLFSVPLGVDLCLWLAVPCLLLLPIFELELAVPLLLLFSALLDLGSLLSLSSSSALRNAGSCTVDIKGLFSSISMAGESGIENGESILFSCMFSSQT